MEIETKNIGAYTLIRVLEDISLTQDISPIFSHVEKGIQAGRLHFALSFTAESFLYTHHISILIRCLVTIQHAKGTLTIIAPNRDLVDVLAVIAPPGQIRMLPSAHELLTAVP